MLPAPPVPGQPGGLVLYGLAHDASRLWVVGTLVREVGEWLSYSPYAAFWEGDRWTAVPVTSAGSILTGASAANGVVLASAFDGTVVRLTTSGDIKQVAPQPGADTLNAIAADTSGRGSAWAVGALFVDATTKPALYRAPGMGQGGSRVSTGYGGSSVTWIGPATGSGEADAFGHFDVGGLPVGGYQIITGATGCAPGVTLADIRAGRVTSLSALVRC